MRVCKHSTLYNLVQIIYSILTYITYVPKNTICFRVVHSQSHFTNEFFRYMLCSNTRDHTVFLKNGKLVLGEQNNFQKKMNSFSLWYVLILY